MAPKRKIPKLSTPTKLRILEEFEKIGWKPAQISKNLNSTGFYSTSRWSVNRFLSNYESRTHISRSEGSGRKSAISPLILSLIQEQMEKDDETMAYQIQHLLKQQGITVEMRTIDRWRRKLGWRFTGSKYCQSIRKENVEKRKVWAEQVLEQMKDGYRFHDIIFTDECKIQLDRHGRKCHKRLGFKIKMKGRHKHPISVMVWAGISKKGPTDLIIFEGIMEADFFINTCMKQGLLSSAKRLYPDGKWKLQQDNDPKHASLKAKKFFEKKRINWWRTPAESPDTNPIENLWAELKWYLRTEVKPMLKHQLIKGIQQFWATVGKKKCKKYINHLFKVIPAVVAENGGPTGY